MPEPRDQDNWEEDRERFAHQMSEWLSDPLVELWFSDESGIEETPDPANVGPSKVQNQLSPTQAVIFGATLSARSAQV